MEPPRREDEPPADAQDGSNRPPTAGTVQEMLVTAEAVGYPPGVVDGPVDTTEDIERIVNARLGWER